MNAQNVKLKQENKMKTKTKIACNNFSDITKRLSRCRHAAAHGAVLVFKEGRYHIVSKDIADKINNNIENR